MSYLPCLNTSTIRPASLPDKIDAAAAAGFRAIEPWNADVDAYLAGGGTMDEIRQRLASHDLAVVSMIAIMGFVGNTEPGRDERLAEARRRMQQAKELGSPFIVASPPMGRADLAVCGRDYAELLELGREIGIRPAMEFLGFVEHVNSIATAREIMDRSGDPSATIVIDWFHMVRGDGRDTILSDLRALTAAQIAIVHLDDVPYPEHLGKPFREMTDGDRVYPGDGDIPLDELFGILEEIGYAGPVSLELFREDLWQQDPYQVVKTGREKSRRWLP
jgi:sugar phosphate isomerase/epimerase